MRTLKDSSTVWVRLEPVNSEARGFRPFLYGKTSTNFQPTPCTPTLEQSLQKVVCSNPYVQFYIWSILYGGLPCWRRVFGPGSHAHRFVYISNKPRVCCSLPSLRSDSNQFLKTAVSSSPGSIRIIRRSTFTSWPYPESDDFGFVRHQIGTRARLTATRGYLIINSPRLDNRTNWIYFFLLGGVEYNVLAEADLRE
jgi:hypothetical protein